jgi:hypothetical protein
MKKGSKQTPEAIEKNLLAHLGRKDSPETLERKRQSHLGERNAFFGKHHTPETLELMKRPKTDIHRQHLSESKKHKTPKNIEILKTSRVGTNNSEEQILKQKESLAKPEVKDRMKLSHVGDKNINWKNGRTPLNERIRESSKYYEWRNAIYKRDNYTDVTTGERGDGNLNVHHLVPYSEIMDRNNITTYEEAMACDELWDISNGITMIDRNHVKLHMKTGHPE